MYYLLTWINIMGGVYASYMLIGLARGYMIAPRMRVYIFLTVAAMFYLVISQAYTLTSDPGYWKLKLAAFFWWGKTVYLAWAIRFSSIKK